MSEENKSDSISTQNAAILERLSRLEEIVLKAPNVTEKANKDQVHPTVEASVTARPEQDPAIDQLEIQCMTKTSVRSLLSEDIFCEAHPLRELGQLKTFVLRETNHSAGLQPYRCVFLPEKHETLSLLDIYFGSTTYMFHIIHIPSVKNLVGGIYQNLGSSNTYDCRHVALLLSILASTAYMWSSQDMHHGLFGTIGEAHKQAVSWTKSALDLIEHSCRISNTSLELLQATIIISFMVFNLEGLTPKWRCHLSSAIALARDISLHQIDQPSPRKVTDEFSIEKEVGRRIWWHLTATDWMLAGMSGPQEGIYAIHPTQMKVNKPLRIDDDSLQSGRILNELSRSEPSTMSYFLERIRLAELTRESLAFIGSDIDDIGYEGVLRVDRKIKQFLDELPPFFLLESETHVENANAGITVQRYVINFLTNSRRCKLHLPFLRRDDRDEKYQPSRLACLEASRQIIRTERLFENEGSPYAISHMRFAGTLYSLFTACTVLAVDLCYHKMSRKDDERVKELREACKILKTGRADSPFVHHFVGSLVNVLRRHKVNLPNEFLLDLENSQPSPDSVSIVTSDTVGTPQDVQGYNKDFSVFDEIWQDFRNEIDLDTLNWNDIFAELDSQAL